MKNNSNTQSWNMRFVAAISLGTVLEWYDFSLYGFLSAIFADVFFPHENVYTSIILTYSVFAIGFFVRPLGAILFGHYGDKYGRKKALLNSIVIMTITTSLIGFLPTFSQIGVTATFLLIVLRLLQGIAVGGEAIGSGAFVIESLKNNRRGFLTSLTWASSGIGILLSSAVVFVISHFLSHKALYEWGWRVPFFLSSFTGLLGYYFRKHTYESSYFESMQIRRKLEKIPLVAALKNFKKEMAIVLGLYTLCAITTYLIFVFMPIYAYKIIGLPFSQSVAINSLSMTCMIIFVPIVGHYSDKIGRKIFLLVSAVGILISAYPVYVLIGSGSLFYLAIGQLIFAILTAGYQGAVMGAALEIFPIQIRFTAAALSYNLSYSLFGGTAAIIATFLIKKLDSISAPSLYLIIGAIIGIISVINLRETYKAELL